MKKKYRIASLFSGCGGLDLGFIQNGYEVVWANDFFKDAVETYRKNIGDHIVYGDITQIPSSNIPDDIDILLGGFPCQGFSVANTKRSMDDKRNFLYKELMRLIEDKQPKYFVGENVKGLLSIQKGQVINMIVNDFKSLGYDVDYRLLKASDYGVPQNRPRVLVIGVRKNINSKIDKEDFFPKKDESYPHLSDLLSDLLDNNYNKTFVTSKYLSEPKTKIQKILRTKKNRKSFLKKGEKITEQEYSKHSDLVVKKFKSMLNNKGVIEKKFKTKKFSQRLLTKNWNSKGPNITATSLPDDYVHFSQPRTLTVREWARLQMFPDWYTFKGKRHTGGIRRAGNPQKGIFDREVPKYTQIGNAVPVELARRVGLNLKKIIFRN